MTRKVSVTESKQKILHIMVNFSHTDAKRETIYNGTSTPLSRDFERTQLFSYIKSEDQIFHLQVMKKNTDSLAGMSWDATPLVSRLDYLNLHMDYGIDFNEYWHAQFAYDWLRTDMAQADEFPLLWPDALGSNVFNGEYKNSTYTAELTYKETIGNNRVTAGVKWRLKKLDSFTKDGQDALLSPFTEEMISSIFFQDQYALSDQELLTLGVSYNYISRNGGMENDSLLQLRLGYIYTSEHWSYKTYLYRTQFALDPLTRYLYFSTISDVEPQTTLGMTHEVAYKEENYHLRLMLLMMRDEDGLVQNTGTGETRYFFTIFNYDYDFDLNNKMNLQVYYAKYKKLANIDRLEDVSGYLSFMNSYEEFDFYNGVVWHQNSINDKNYFDVTSSVSWNVNENLTLTLKGENLLDKAKKTSIFRIDPSTGNMLAPLEVSPIDRRITLELEYLF